MFYELHASECKDLKVILLYYSSQKWGWLQPKDAKYIIPVCEGNAFYKLGLIFIVVDIFSNFTMLWK